MGGRPWSTEEDCALRAAISRVGVRWRRLSCEPALVGRSATALRLHGGSSFQRIRQLCLPLLRLLSLWTPLVALFLGSAKCPTSVRGRITCSAPPSPLVGPPNVSASSSRCGGWMTQGAKCYCATCRLLGTAKSDTLAVTIIPVAPSPGSGTPGGTRAWHERETARAHACDPTHMSHD
jgi:hypothetical protein